MSLFPVLLFFIRELLGSQCSQSDIKITPAIGEFIELNAGGTLCRKAEAEGFEPSVEVLACASPKLRPACIFNNFIKLLAARSGNVVRRLRRSRLRLPYPVAASLLA